MISVDAAELKEKIDSGENILIVDVRTPQELIRGRIPGSVNIPLDVFEEVLEKKLIDKNEEIYLYCLSGSRSEVAAQIMDNLGYKNVYNLISGMLAWRNKQYPEVHE